MPIDYVDDIPDEVADNLWRMVKAGAAVLPATCRTARLTHGRDRYSA
jgi:hypothetical protein